MGCGEYYATTRRTFVLNVWGPLFRPSEKRLLIISWYFLYYNHLLQNSGELFESLTNKGVRVYHQRGEGIFWYFKVGNLILFSIPTLMRFTMPFAVWLLCLFQNNSELDCHIISVFCNRFSFLFAITYNRFGSSTHI